MLLLQRASTRTEGCKEKGSDADNQSYTDARCRCMNGCQCDRICSPLRVLDQHPALEELESCKFHYFAHSPRAKRISSTLVMSAAKLIPPASRVKVSHLASFGRQLVITLQETFCSPLCWATPSPSPTSSALKKLPCVLVKVGLAARREALE